MRSITRNRRRGFTLLEVLMVIVILGVLIALIAPSFMGAGEQARKDLTKASIEGLAKQVELFRMHCQRYPTTEEGLAALMTKPGSEDIAEKWAGPYLQKPAKDGWNKDLRYAAPGRMNEATFDIWSDGPDGREGSEDDIGNWEKSK
jgi:general secretion pathway protein G